MGLLKDDIKKVPKGLLLREYYARIYEWHKMNKNKVFTKLKYRGKDDPYVKCYLKLVDALPDPRMVSKEDIAMICREIIAGLMEWAYHEEDRYHVKVAAYAHYILDTFFDGFSGKTTLKLAQKSKLYSKYSVSNCMSKYRAL